MYIDAERLAAPRILAYRWIREMMQDLPCTLKDGCVVPNNWHLAASLNPKPKPLDSRPSIMFACFASLDLNQGSVVVS